MAFKLFYGSSYDRGLEYLLFMWPEIREKYPDTELHICYGWQTFEALMRNNPERMAWKERMDMFMRQEGIVHHGRLGKEELAKVRRGCDIWAYPTDFTEINCITALECQRDGVVPVTMNYAALQETVGAGVKIDGDIKDITVQKKYLEALFGLMGDKKRLEAERARGIEFAKGYTWKHIADEWVNVFKKPVSDVTVSVITVTIREGFWGVMAKSLARQTYKPFEWIVVDDHKEDRSKIAEKIGKEFGLNVVYKRGGKALGTYKRKYGLVRANNIGWTAAKGELLVYLQDFILPPDNGIERLVDVYRHNPDAIIAPVDVKCVGTEPDKKNAVDWWNGEDPKLEAYWKNVRVQGKGIRESSNPYDFEMNYAGIPRAIAAELNGWWEFFDDGMGYDNTEFAMRVLRKGYRLLIDDGNICKAIDIGDHGLGLNEKGWGYFMKSDLPNERNEAMDKEIHV